MKIERTKNASRNMFYGVILKIYQLAIPFVMRTIMVRMMGPGYAGLNSLFTSVLQVLNLAELGVGSAMIFSMYKPIADDDNEKICALMKLYKTYYRIIGLVVAVIGCCLLPYIPVLVKSDLPADVNIYVLYIMNLSATVLTYWLFAYKNSILTAHQRNDVASKIAIIVDTIKYVVQILVLVVLRNYYLYVLVILFTQVINNITTAIISQKLYPDFNPRGNLDKTEVKTINKRIRDLFTSKLGSVILTSADSIVISAFLGLKMLAIYQNYYFPVSAIMGFVTIIFTSISAGVGNSIVTESIEKNFNDLKKLSFIIIWIAGFCSACFLSLMQPFMEIWMGKSLMVEYTLVILLVVYFYICEINTLLNSYKDAAGLWHEDRFRPLVTAIVNLGMNIGMVQFWGLYGIILSTVLSMALVGMPWLLKNLFTVLFKREQFVQFFKLIVENSMIVIIVCIVNTIICNQVNVSLLANFLIRLAISIVIPNLLFFIAYRKKNEFKQSIQLMDKITKGKIKSLHNYAVR